MKRMNQVILTNKNTAVNVLNSFLWLSLLLAATICKNTEVEEFWIVVNVVIYCIGFFMMLFFCRHNAPQPQRYRKMKTIFSQAQVP